jgi:hypothetical protein
MKKLTALLLFIFISISAISQVVAYKPLTAYVRAKETLWDWTDLELEYDDMPVIKIYYNNSTDAYSRIDKLKISNKYQDDFRFPYRGTLTEDGILYSVIDNKGVKNKIIFDFENYDDGYFDIIIKYSNIEYAYRLKKQQ